MLSCDQVLERASKDGSIDIEDWSRNFDEVLQRLHHNVHNVFPIPSIPTWPSTPPPAVITNTPSKPLSNAATEPLSQTSNNGDTLPNTPTPSVSQQTSQLPLPIAPQPPSTSNSQLQDQPSPLPPHLLITWNYVHSTLTQQFSKYPPHTIQRLSELILNPNQFYRFLPSYLNALDRVVSVSSGSHVFPLPAIELASQASASLVNGAAVTTASSSNFNSDESLGGALLTPIPWLRNIADSSGAESETESPTASASSAQFDGHANIQHQAIHQQAGGLSGSDTEPGDAMISDDTDMSSSTASAAPSPQSAGTGAVTQGELLRREQEASSPPAAVASALNRDHVLVAHGSATSPPPLSSSHDQLQHPPNTLEEDELAHHEHPHARGPEEIGPEDTGILQAAGDSTESHMVLDLEAAVGRSAVAHSHKSPPVYPPTVSSTSAPELAKDSDGDIVVGDADNNEQVDVPDGDADGGILEAPDEEIQSKQRTRAGVAALEKKGG